MSKLLLLSAIDVRSAMTVAMIVIGFVVWIIKQVAAAKEAAPPPTVRPRRPKPNDPLQNEIEQFMRESAERQRSDDSLIEVVPEEEIVRRQRQRPPKSQRPANRPPRSQQNRPRADARSRSAGGGVQPQATSSVEQLGSGVRSHLQEYMESRRVDQSVQQHMAGGVQRSVQQHLGRTVTAETVERRGEHPLARALRNPVSVQQAVIFSEILTPRYKRKR